MGAGVGRTAGKRLRTAGRPSHAQCRLPVPRSNPEGRTKVRAPCAWRCTKKRTLVSGVDAAPTVGGIWKMSGQTRFVSKVGRVRADSGPMLVDTLPNLAGFAPDLADSGPRFADTGPMLVAPGPMLVAVGRCRANLGRNLLTSAQHRSNSAQIWSTRSRVDRDRSSLSRLAEFGPASTTVDPISNNIDQITAISTRVHPIGKMWPVVGEVSRP